jgi:hypothetical protein
MSLRNLTNQRKNYIRLTALLAVVLTALVTVLGSGGSSGGGSSQSEGTFNDAFVEGVDFSSGDNSGQTDGRGAFPYDSQPGQPTMVTFSIGGIVLGTGEAKPFMSPIDLVPGATDVNDPQVTNIAQVLQTLDDDDDPTNGITITQAIRDAAAMMNFDFSSPTFDTDVAMDIATLTALRTAGPRMLVSDSDAQNHLNNTLLSNLAGPYNGTFEGQLVPELGGMSGSGTWEATVQANGMVTGTATDPDGLISGTPGTILPLSGTVTAGGILNLTDTLTGAVTIIGMITQAGSVTGDVTVVDPQNPTTTVATGTITGVSGSAPPPGGPPMSGTCDADGLPGRFVTFEMTPNDESGTYMVEECVAFECQVDAGANCTLQVFDITGTDRFMQFLTLSNPPFPVDINSCFGFDAVFMDNVRTGLALDLIGDPAGRQFGDPTATMNDPFATGSYQERFGTDTLGTFRAFEFTATDEGFKGTSIPVQACEGGLGG